MIFVRSRQILLAAAFGLVALSLTITTEARADTAAPYKNVIRYDLLGRVTGTITANPDDSGPLKYAATRATYDMRGNPIKIEIGELASWQATTIAAANWTDFTVLTSIENSFDEINRKRKTVRKGSNGAITDVTQFSYDDRGRLECTAVRMNPAIWNNLPVSACILGAQGTGINTHGPDRITRTIYDAASQVKQVRRAVGTPLEQAYATYDYTLSGQQKYVIDANGNKAEMVYDGYDRLIRWSFPSKANPTGYNDATPATALTSAGALSAADYEQYDYDANGNRTSLRKRDGSLLTYEYDDLNRVIRKVVPSRPGLAAVHTRDVYYQYDLRGLQLKARFDSLSGPGVDNAYDGFGRMISSTNSMGSTPLALTYEYDKNGNRTKVIHPDNKAFLYSYDGLNRLELVQESGSTPVDLKSYSYNQRGLRAGEKDANGAVAASSYGYDPIGRLTDLDRNLSGSSSDVNFDFTYNPASQIKTRKISNSLYAATAHYNIDRNYTVNGLNQYTTANANPTPVGTTKFEYDANGNLTRSGKPETQNGPLTPENSTSYIYDVENRLVSASGKKTASLIYDPLGRLYQTVGDGAATTKRFLYDGDALVEEYNASGTMLDRYVHGGGVDDPIIWYNGATIGSTTRRHLQNNWQGSVIAIQNSSGGMVQANGYDDYGIPNDTNLGRFQYTGQIWIPELEIYHYKARAYSPTLGRFMQTDPIGYEDQVNLYAYVGNDPANMMDPSGQDSCTLSGCRLDQLVATGKAPSGPDREMNLAEKAFTGIFLASFALATPFDEAVVARAAFSRIGLGGFAVHAGTIGKGALGLSTMKGFAAASNLFKNALTNKGNFGLGSATREASEELGMAWVGKGATKSKTGNSWVSEDRTRTFRSASQKSGGKTQANFERRVLVDDGKDNKSWEVVGNGHLDIN